MGAVDEVCGFALFPAVHIEGVVKVDGVGFYHGSDGVVKVQTVAAQTLENIVG